MWLSGKDVQLCVFGEGDNKDRIVSSSRYASHIGHPSL